MVQEFIVPNRLSVGNSVYYRSFFTSEVAENKDGRPCLYRSYARIPPRPQLKMHDSSILSIKLRKHREIPCDSFSSA
ncbi:hypothetical protein Pan258_07940 [Symmachiella dynata]|nr:hypothetical protein Pan258_07940 [Symmachiella dynata]